MKTSIHRKKHGSVYDYFNGDKQIIDLETIERINHLAIPPAWKDVEISTSKSSKVQVIGYDSAGRKQAIYNPIFRAKQEQAKFDRIVQFGNALPKLRRQIERDLRKRKLTKEKVLACVVKLIDEAYFRVGNDNYAKENNSYGITTLRRKHANITTTSVTFDFIGKSGKRHVKKITDSQLARIIKQLDELPGYEIFQYINEQGHIISLKSRDVNEYIHTYMGQVFSAKDFRTWGGTLLAAQFLALIIRKDEAQSKKDVISCVKHVAKKLGNTPTIARSSYIDPRIISLYLKDNSLAQTYESMKHSKRSKYVLPQEKFALKVFQQLAA